ncbi:MAG: flagellar cap protein [Gammaproteobacteria bacterium]|nr:MAG: flagellar cap protein [Gammaproteobacteria bacterium]
MTIQVSGLATGLDVDKIITSLMEIEEFPINRLETKIEIAEAQISAYGQLSSAVSTFQDAMSNLSSLSSFKILSSESSDESVLTVSTDAGATTGIYNVEVIQLAKNDKIATQAYNNASSTVGEGTLTISTGADSFDFVIDSSNSSVQDIRDAINNASDNTGVTASIITDDNGARLILSTDDTGSDNALKIEVSDIDGNNTDDSGLSALAYEVGVTVHRAEISQNQDSIIKVDGFTSTNSTNTISGVIEGASLTIAEVGSSTLTISRDNDAIIESVETFVSAFNALRSEIESQSNGQLEADSTILIMERQLQDVLNSGGDISGSNFSYLIEAGVSIDASGVMSVDTSELESKLSSDFDSVANLFAAENEGFAYKLEALADAWLDDDGLIDAREDGLQDRIDRMDDQILRIEDRLISVESRIRAQFTALEALVSSLNSTGDYLTQQLAALNND